MSEKNGTEILKTEEQQLLERLLRMLQNVSVSQAKTNLDFLNHVVATFVFVSASGNKGPSLQVEREAFFSALDATFKIPQNIGVGSAGFVLRLDGLLKACQAHGVQTEERDGNVYLANGPLKTALGNIGGWIVTGKVVNDFAEQPLGNIITASENRREKSAARQKQPTFVEAYDLSTHRVGKAKYPD